MSLFTGALALAGAALSGHPAWVQGSLGNAGGPVDGVYDLTLSVYSVAANGSAIVTQSFDAVQVVDGRFAVAFDAFTPEALTSAQLWVGVAVESEPELPRARLGAAPLATLAEYASSLRCTQCVQQEQMAKLSVGNDQLQTWAVTSEKIAPRAVAEPNLAFGAVDTLNIRDKALVAAHFAAGAVGTAALADGGVTTAKLSPTAVVSSVIVDETIQSQDLAPGAVGAVQIAPNSVGSTHVAIGGIDSSRIAFGVTGGSFCNVTTATKIKDPGDAIFCALSYVDDDSAAGWCKVYQTGAGWFVQTGSDCGSNACSWICLN